MKWIKFNIFKDNSNESKRFQKQRLFLINLLTLQSTFTYTVAQLDCLYFDCKIDDKTYN